MTDFEKTRELFKNLGITFNIYENDDEKIIEFYPISDIVAEVCFRFNKKGEFTNTTLIDY